MAQKVLRKNAVYGRRRVQAGVACLIALVIAAVVLGSQNHAAPPGPAGIAGKWKLVFHDEFNGTSLDTNVWTTHNGFADQNSVTDHASNVTESGGDVTLKLASPSSGGAIETLHAALDVGDVAQARVEFAGSGPVVFNWPAFWSAGPGWPASGENDVAEGLYNLTVNYHSSTGTKNEGTVPGTWVGAFHTYAVERLAHESKVFWDGKLVKTYPTNDNGQPQNLIFTVGAAKPIVTGAKGELRVDYVRLWAPA